LRGFASHLRLEFHSGGRGLGGLHIIDIVPLFPRAMAKKALAVKIPTNRTLFYETADDISSVNWSTGYKFNLVRDLAAVNRHNVAHTTSKGVPLVYRCAVTMTPKPAAENANRLFSEDDNLVHVAEVLTAPVSWVTRNSAVKTHAARENMYKQQGVKKSERGAYSRTLRPTWEAAPDTFLTPLKGSASGGASYSMGTWDYSSLQSEDSAMSHVRIVGDDGMLSLYLDSRKQISADSNSDSDDINQPVDTNILRNLLSPTLGISDKNDEVVALARDEQDNPPYSLDNDGDHTDPILAGRQFIGGRAGITSTEVYDIPFGIFAMNAMNAFFDGGGTAKNQGFAVKVEILGIYAM